MASRTTTSTTPCPHTPEPYVNPLLISLGASTLILMVTLALVLIGKRTCCRKDRKKEKGKEKEEEKEKETEKVEVEMHDNECQTTGSVFCTALERAQSGAPHVYNEPFEDDDDSGLPNNNSDGFPSGQQTTPLLTQQSYCEDDDDDDNDDDDDEDDGGEDIYGIRPEGQPFLIPLSVPQPCGTQTLSRNEYIDPITPPIYMYKSGSFFKDATKRLSFPRECRNLALDTGHQDGSSSQANLNLYHNSIPRNLHLPQKALTQSIESWLSSSVSMTAQGSQRNSWESRNSLKQGTRDFPQPCTHSEHSARACVGYLEPQMPLLPPHLDAPFIPAPPAPSASQTPSSRPPLNDLQRKESTQREKPVPPPKPKRYENVWPETQTSSQVNQVKNTAEKFETCTCGLPSTPHTFSNLTIPSSPSASSNTERTTTETSSRPLLPPRPPIWPPLGQKQSQMSPALLKTMVQKTEGPAILTLSRENARNDLNDEPSQDKKWTPLLFTPMSMPRSESGQEIQGALKKTRYVRRQHSLGRDTSKCNKILSGKSRSRSLTTFDVKFSLHQSQEMLQETEEGRLTNRDSYMWAVSHSGRYGRLTDMQE